MTTYKHFTYWIILAPLSLILTGLGLSLAIEAGIWKFQQYSIIQWVSLGTMGLVFFNIGLCLFGAAVMHRISYKQKKFK